MLAGQWAQCGGRGFSESSRPAAAAAASLWSLPIQQRHTHTHGKADVSSSVTMVSTAVTISPMDPSSQDMEDTEASTPLNPLQESAGCQGGAAPSWWLPFFKPILTIGVGTLLFLLGTTLSLLYFIQVGNVPYLLGPLCLAAGLMFLVTGLVWIPVLKERLEHHALIKVIHGKELQMEHKHH